jgi:hypothetical protein
MAVKPLRNVPVLLVACSLRRESAHPATAAAVEGCYRDKNGFITMCSNCRRTRRVGCAPQIWDWVSAFVANPPDCVSHGICGLCLEYYYGPAADVDW